MDRLETAEWAVKRAEEKLADANRKLENERMLKAARQMTSDDHIQYVPVYTGPIRGLTEDEVREFMDNLSPCARDIIDTIDRLSSLTKSAS